MTVIQYYAPINDAADPEQKDTFYESIQADVEKTSSQDLLIVMGDLNDNLELTTWIMRESWLCWWS